MKRRAPDGAHGAGGTKSGDRSQSPTRPWLLQGITLAAVIAASALFFLVYAPSRSEYLVNRNFRLLGDITRQISEAVVNVDGALVNASKGQYTFKDFSNRVSQIIAPLMLSPGNFEPTNSAAQAAKIQLMRDGLTEWLRITYPHASVLTAPNSTEANSNTFTASLDLRKLLPPILARADFADVLITRTDGQVVFQLTQTQNPATNATATTEVRITELPPFNEEGKTNAVTRGTYLLDSLRVAGTSYKLFAQPLRISLGNAPEETLDSWLCGLVRSKDFTTEAWEIPSTVTIVFIFGALGLFLLWPFLNIVFCGPGGDIRRWEAAWVLTAGFLGCAILVFALFYSATWLASEKRSDYYLDHLADQVQSNLVEEFSRVEQLLEQIDGKLIRCTKDCATTPGRSPDQVLQEQERDGIATNYPAILDVFWVNEKGLQIYKWTPRGSKPAMVPVGDRAYFQRIRAQCAWFWDAFVPQRTEKRSGATPNTNQFYVDSVFSKTRSENQAVFSRPFSGDWSWEKQAQGSNIFERPVVTAATFQPLSLFSPILPAGYGFCLTDGAGQVLFHSESHRNLRENFLTEASGNHTLSAAVSARIHDHADVRYYNHIHHVSVIPARGLPWNIITFRDERVLNAVHRNVLAGAGILFSIYLVGALVLWLLVFVVLHYYNGGFFRPLWLALPSRPIRWRNPPTWPLAIGPAALILLLLLLAMLPAFVCYKMALAKEMTAYVRATALQLARDVGQRSVAERLSDGRKPGGEHRRSTYSQFLYDMTVTNQAAFPTNTVTWFDELYAAVRPRFAETELKLGGMDLPYAWDGSWRSGLEHNKLWLSVEPATGSDGPKPITVSSSFPGLSWSDLWPAHGFDEDLGWHLLWYLGLIATVCAPLLAASFVAKHLLLASLPRELRDAPRPPDVCIAGLVPETVNTKLSQNAFAAVESTRIQVLQNQRGFQQTGSLEPDAVLFVPVGSAPDEQLQRKLRQARYRNVVLVFERAGVCARKHWALTPSKLEVEASSPASSFAPEQECSLRLAVARTLSLAYAELWKNCSAGERLTLHQIAQSGFIPAQRAEVRVLLDKGLLRFAPELCLRNESFKRFVLATFGPRDLAEAAPAQNQVPPLLSWRSLRVPIGVAITAGAMFLFATQKELWQLALGLAGSFATASQGLSRITSVFGKSNTGGADGEGESG